MIQADFFVRSLREAGFRLFSGTPCSYLTPLINRVIDSPETEYIGATNEGDAVAIAAGAELGGWPGVVLFQNSGLGNAVNPLTSLTTPFRIPILIITTWRGRPGDRADEPPVSLTSPPVFGRCSTATARC
jgi:phosphonopyruvate decarboxylase